MSKKNASPPAPKENEKAQDLAQLRDILFGNQARATEDRLNDLENRLHSVSNDLNSQIDSGLESTAQTAAKALAKARQALSQQIEDQQKESYNKFNQTHEKIDQLATDFAQQLKNAQQELQKNINQQVADLNRKLLDFQSEARRSDDNLRLEMLTLGSLLENQKAGRAELAAMFIQMANQLQEENGNTAPADSENQE